VGAPLRPLPGKKPVGSGHPKIFLGVETCGGLGVEDDELAEGLAGAGAACGEHGVRTVREGNAARVVEGRIEGGWRTCNVRNFASAFFPNWIKSEFQSDSLSCIYSGMETVWGGE